jgi:hypothetical protein
MNLTPSSLDRAPGLVVNDNDDGPNEVNLLEISEDPAPAFEQKSHGSLFTYRVSWCCVSLGVLSPHPKIYVHFHLSCIQHLYSSGSTEQFCPRHQDKQINIVHVGGCLVIQGFKIWSNSHNFSLIIWNKTLIACPQLSKIYIKSCMKYTDYALLFLTRWMTIKKCAQ